MYSFYHKITDLLAIINGGASKFQLLHILGVECLLGQNVLPQLDVELQHVLPHRLLSDVTPQWLASARWFHHGWHFGGFQQNRRQWFRHFRLLCDDCTFGQRRDTVENRTFDRFLELAGGGWSAFLLSDGVDDVVQVATLFEWVLALLFWRGWWRSERRRWWVRLSVRRCVVAGELELLHGNWQEFHFRLFHFCFNFFSTKLDDVVVANSELRM
jgi:hypothetical protein